MGLAEPYSREEILELLGYSSYENYLSRVLWKRIKQRVLERDDATCRRCKGKATLVHHRSYSRDVLEGLDDSQLVSICEGCHHVVEFYDNGFWRPEKEKDEVLFGGAPIVPLPPFKIDLRVKKHPRPAEWERMEFLLSSVWHSY
jgi:hypothetical protein